MQFWPNLFLGRISRRRLIYVQKMRYIHYLLAGMPLLLLCNIYSCSSFNGPGVNSNGPEVIHFQAVPFEITDVRLLEGSFLHATEMNEGILLNYKPDRFLAKFRLEAGLEANAEHYHGWEDNTIAGHSLGHYLTAISLMYQTTGRQEYRDRAIYITDELSLCQDADGEGYLGAFPEG